MNIALVALLGAPLSACSAPVAQALSPFTPTETAIIATLTTPPPTQTPFQPTPTPHVPTAPPSPRPTPTATTTALPTRTSAPTATPIPLVRAETPGANGQPTLADFWEGRATFVMQVEDTGLPMGESDTLVMSNGELWSYMHANAASAGIVDRCGAPVAFPGCVVRYRSTDGGYSFQLAEPVCLFPCAQCPCDSEGDNIDQQQYPRLAYDGQTLFLVYEYRGRVRLRRSTNGLTWGPIEIFPYSTIWKRWLRGCAPEESIARIPSCPTITSVWRAAHRGFTLWINGSMC